MNEILRFFSYSSLFQNIPAQELLNISESYPWLIHSYKKDEIIGFPGDELSELRGVISGILSAEMTDSSGKSMLIETLGPGSFIASPLLFSSQPLLPVQIRILEDARIATIQKQAFLKLTASNPRVLEKLLTEGADKIAFLAEKIRLLQFDSLQEKLAGWLLRQTYLQNPRSKNETNTITLPFTQDTLANMLGVTRPALGRTLGELIDSGCIQRLSRGSYVIHREKIRNLMNTEIPGS